MLFGAFVIRPGHPCGATSLICGTSRYADDDVFCPKRLDPNSGIVMIRQETSSFGQAD